MKTNTNLAMISIDLAIAQRALEDLMPMYNDVSFLHEKAVSLRLKGEFITALYRLEDAKLHLKLGISEMKRIIRKKKYAANRKSGGGTRAQNRTITGIG